MKRRDLPSVAATSGIAIGAGVIAAATYGYAWNDDNVGPWLMFWLLTVYVAKQISNTRDHTKGANS